MLETLYTPCRVSFFLDCRLSFSGGLYPPPINPNMSCLQQYSTAVFLLSILNSQFSILNSQFSISTAVFLLSTFYYVGYYPTSKKMCQCDAFCCIFSLKMEKRTNFICIFAKKAVPLYAFCARMLSYTRVRGI